MSQSKMESEATELVKRHDLLSDIQDGQILLFEWEHNEVAFIVKHGMLVQVPVSEITATRPRDSERHVLFVEKEPKEEEPKDEDSGNGGWVRTVLNWIGELFSSGTVSGSSVEPTIDPVRPDLPTAPGTPPLVPPVTPRPTIPTTEPAWGAGVTIKVLRWKTF